MFGFKPQKGTIIERGQDEEACEKLLENNDPASAAEQFVSSGPRTVAWTMTVLLVVCAALLSAALGAWVSRRGGLHMSALCTLHTSRYSSVLHDVRLSYSNVRFNGSLLKSNEFRLDAGPEVDAAWKSLGADYHAASIPVEEAARSGLAPDQVKIKDEYGGGFPVHVEGLHHLHCLNLLRRSLAWNFNYYQTQGLGPFSNDARVLKHHVTHCLDILRQQLMCTVDVGVLGQVWYQPPDKPLQAFVEFNTVHKCRNFDAVRDWAERHQLPDVDNTPADFLEPPKDGDRIWHAVP